MESGCKPVPCFSPLTAWRGRRRNKNGRLPVVFDRRESSGVEIELPCGQCVGCRLEYSRQWAMRCMHEASLWPENSYLTLTYGDGHLPVNGSLRKADFQKFMKRLRKKNPGKRIRYYQCGEYGEELKRPHYHALLFNHAFRSESVV